LAPPGTHNLATSLIIHANVVGIVDFVRQLLFDKGCFITFKSNYTQLLHNQNAYSRLNVSSQESDKTKLGEIHIEAIKYKTPKRWVGLQSIDYDATHVGKKYPSLQPPTVYRHL
jgi:formyltetrahydrofolate hydrolase